MTLRGEDFEHTAERRDYEREDKKYLQFYTKSYVFRNPAFCGIFRSGCAGDVDRFRGAVYFFDRSSQENASRTMLQSLEQLRGSLEYVIEDTQKLSRSIIYDADVQALLEKAASGEEYPETDAVQDFINGFIVDRDYIESVVVVGRMDTLFSSERAYTNVSSPDQIRKKWWYPSLDEQETAYQWFDQAKRNKDEEDLFGEQGSDNCLMLTRTIRSLKDYTTPLGRMMIYLENDYIKDLIHSISWGDTLSVWVCSNEGRMYLANDSGRSRWDLLDDVLSLEMKGTLHRH